jgi:hypothetical protein
MMDMSEKYANNPHLAACARKLDMSLRPINDAILARLGLTRAEVIAEMDMVDSAPSAFITPPTPLTDSDPTRKTE